MITMITDRIGIGDASDGNQLPSAADAALNLAIEVDIPLTGGDAHKHKVGLVDGPGNDDFLLLAAVLLLHSLNRKYRRVIVHCQSQNYSTRSITVVAMYVSITGNMEFDRVFNDIMKVRGATAYRKPLYQQAVKLLPMIRNIIGNV